MEEGNTVYTLILICCYGFIWNSPAIGQAALLVNHTWWVAEVV